MLKASNIKFLSLNFLLFTSTMAIANSNNPNAIPLYANVYGGYSVISGAHDDDGDVATGRFGLGLYGKQYNDILLSVELGLQSGNTMRLEGRSSIINLAGGLPPQAVLKPVVDFLFSAKGRLPVNQNLFYIAKAGVAYRQLHLQDRTSSKDNLNKFAPEFQFGLGAHITKQVSINGIYQVIYSNKNADIRLDSAGSATISKIPTQQAGFLGLEYSFF